MPRILLALAVSLLNSGATAQETLNTGSEMLRHCTSSNSDPMRGYCLGVVSGMLAVSRLLEPEFRFCTERGVTAGQMVRVAVKFMEDNPAMLHRNFDVLALIAFQRTWPCR